MGASDLTLQYHAEWLCVSAAALTETGIRLVVSPRRDQAIAGYSTPIPLYLMIREGQVTAAVGAAFSEAHAGLADYLRFELDRLAVAAITQDQLAALLTRLGIKEVEWSVKFRFSHLAGTETAAPAFALQPADYSRFEAFYRAMHPEQERLDWLEPYFDGLARKRLCWAVAIDERLVAVTDAPSMPYMEDSIVEIGINTHPAHRRQGHGRCACQGMLREILAQGKVPIWSCRVDNRASRALATSLGFEEFGVAAIVRASMT